MSFSRHRKWRLSFAVLVSAVAIVLAGPGIAYAAPPTALDPAAPAADRTYQPAFDYDGDGCYPTPAIGRDGTIAPGLALGGAVNGQCHDLSDLDNTNSYSRSKCNNGWCAYIYGLYFEKDQTLPGCCGHRHDWEHVVVWVQGGTAQYVAASAHGNYSVRPRAQLFWEGTHPKIIYHKDGLSTHAFRFASATEPPENHKGTWQFPALVGWDGYPPGLRDRLVAHNFGSASFGLKDASFAGELAKAKPAGIPFDPQG
ncbi:Necrosis inducing protein (NPP1) [Nonomuraea solani]|uniref:Necrosis inducing protein (NPP1) n=1 Tax=Nonomuraea solani TaxID=1144553 RepID=A0A1H5W2Z5_9ACTN|nr:Necrosis inducing protein (NPP1) [Nonomuraea solani]